MNVKEALMENYDFRPSTADKVLELIQDITDIMNAEVREVTEKVYNEAFEKGMVQGLDDAWEAARGILKLEWNERAKIFDGKRCLIDMFCCYTASEVIEKLRVLKPEQNVYFEPGDEVQFVRGKGGSMETNHLFYYIVTGEGNKPGTYNIIGRSGTVIYNVSKEKIYKTGKRFTDTIEILEWSNNQLGNCVGNDILPVRAL